MKPTKRQLIFSRKYPATHPKKGQPTHFVEKIWTGIIGDLQLQDYVADDSISQMIISNYVSMNLEPKLHTIRNGKKWKVGDVIIPCVWELDGGLYKKGNKKINFAPELEILKIWDFTIIKNFNYEEMCIWIQNDESTVFTVSHFSIKNSVMYSPPESVAKFRDLCKNDGLSEDDFINWFQRILTKKKNRFSGQILCWNKDVEY